ncbi:hypothetical protein LptCag_2112 [Leptospirillum ferriphilum]|uniref:Uncharacterized protein n=1 Tax=Leptospirillum ferriphilum TaxID=178606 RepID=A0A094WG88_9BACT|nr:hypothetical protein LptCag_2112 [Leptospirillum ferriphilum]
MDIPEDKLRRKYSYRQFSKTCKQPPHCSSTEFYVYHLESDFTGHVTSLKPGPISSGNLKRLFSGEPYLSSIFQDLASTVFPLEQPGVFPLVKTYAHGISLPW